MAIPVATTRIRVWRRDAAAEAGGDPWEAPTSELVMVADDVRAVIAIGGGTYAGRTVGPGDSEAVTFTLQADPCGLGYLDVVEDIPTGTRYQVEWAIHTPGLLGALASDAAGLSTRKGAGRAADA